MYIYVQKKKNKKKTKLRLASFGKFISSGTELSPSLSLSFQLRPTLDGKKKGGGATSVGSRLTGELVADPDLSGFSDPRSNGPVKICCYEFT